MKVLIICTQFPPDTSIAAKRPYMFAKYLAEYGHDVVVLCSGEITSKIDTSYNENDTRFRVITYLSEKQIIKPTTSLAHRQARLIPSIIRETAKKVYHALYEPVYIYKRKRLADYHFQKIKIALENLKNEDFDVVFSTFSELSNVYAGSYAKALFGCKWILDFRDRIIQPKNLSWLWNALFRPVERKYVNIADAVTAVSQDLFWGTSYPKSKFFTIYNGYDPIEEEQLFPQNKSKKLSFCYTGLVYGERSIALEFLFKTIHSLNDKGLIDVDNISFEYAGQSEDDLDYLALKYGLESMVNKHGYLLSEELKQLQLNSDVFLVLSWNHAKERGVLTGKFYDGVRVHKPILSIIAGEVSNCELFRLNNEYNYGFCFEQARDSQQEEEFESFVLNMYNQKISRGKVEYQINEELLEKFKYQNLAKELEQLCFSLLV